MKLRENQPQYQFKSRRESKTKKKITTGVQIEMSETSTPTSPEKHEKRKSYEIVALIYNL